MSTDLIQRLRTYVEADDYMAAEGPCQEAADALEWMTWRPIETAPKDGSDILLYCPSGDILTANWDGTGWSDNARGSWRGFDATLWMPLPAPPAA